MTDTMLVPATLWLKQVWQRTLLIWNKATSARYSHQSRRVIDCHNFFTATVGNVRTVVEKQTLVILHANNGVRKKNAWSIVVTCE